MCAVVPEFEKLSVLLINKAKLTNLAKPWFKMSPGFICSLFYNARMCPLIKHWAPCCNTEMLLAKRAHFTSLVWQTWKLNYLSFNFLILMLEFNSLWELFQCLMEIYISVKMHNIVLSLACVRAGVWVFVSKQIILEEWNWKKYTHQKCTTY